MEAQMGKATLISSPANPVIKDVRIAITKGSLTSDGLLVAETFHLLEEALRSELETPLVIAAEGSRAAVENRIRRLGYTRLMVIADSLFSQLSGTESAQGVIALV